MRLELAIPGTAASLGVVIVALSALVGSLLLLRVTPSSGFVPHTACQLASTIDLGAVCWAPE
ncbi:hypothetical protein [Alsobacter sp. SYSU BS001988]